MKVIILENAEELGKKAADLAESIINQSISINGKARVVLSTGTSQFETLKALVNKEIDWNKVEMFHLDEYINLPVDHPASFRKYLKERFVDLVDLKKAYYASGEGDIQGNIAELTDEIRREPIDLGIIGIGENAHIAFNDPPADFETKDAYIIVKLDEQCRAQQVGEGWFQSIEEVPKHALSMSVYQVMQCKHIISSVPDQRKAEAVKLVVENEENPQIPATKLKGHPNWTLFLDRRSAVGLKKEILKQE